jgi:AraC-like DNA-binding protein
LKTYFSHGENIRLISKYDAREFKEKHILAIENDPSASDKFDERVQRCLDWIDNQYSMQDVSISMLSKIAFLSESRLTHLFREQVGTPIRQYILWKRVEMALKKSLEGFSLTESAHHSGFSDSSHFIRTFKKMFGIYPSFVNKK